MSATKKQAKKQTKKAATKSGSTRASKAIAKSTSKKVKLAGGAKTKKPAVASRKQAKKAVPAKRSRAEQILSKAKQTLADLPLTQVPWSEFLAPVGDRVLLVTEAGSEMTSGGLIIPAVAQDEPNRASVVAVGPGGVNKKGRRQPLDVKVGDRVLYQKYAGSKMNLRGESVLLVRESDIIAVLED